MSPDTPAADDDRDLREHDAPTQGETDGVLLTPDGPGPEASTGTAREATEPGATAATPTLDDPGAESPATPAGVPADEGQAPGGARIPPPGAADAGTAPEDTTSSTPEPTAAEATTSAGASSAVNSEDIPAPDTTPALDPDPHHVPVDREDLTVLRTQVGELTGALAALERFSTQVGELARLRARDAGIIEKLHADNTRLRQGELAAATAPLLNGLLRLLDQMGSLAAGDPQSVAGMLRAQLIQILDTAAGVTAFDPAPGEPFDTARHSGAGRLPTPDPAADATVARSIRTGFTRADGTVLRVAEVEVYRHVPEGAGAPAATTRAH